MIDQQFDHIVSLGSHCEMTYHIRRRFGCHATQVFDWLVTPTRALVEIIEDDFAGLCLPENMGLIYDGAGVLCDRYGTVHYHDFPHAKADDKFALDFVKADCVKARQKFAALARRFRLLRGRVLFIRVDPGIVYQGERNGDFDDALFLRLTRAIERMLPRIDYQILLLRSEYRGKHPRLHRDTVERYGEAGWNGSDRGWDEMFDRQRIGYAGAESGDDIGRLNAASAMAAVTEVNEVRRRRVARPARRAAG